MDGCATVLPEFQYRGVDSLGSRLGIVALMRRAFLAMAKSGKAGSTGPVENYDKPDIRRLPCGFWVGRWDSSGGADRLMHQCLITHLLDADERSA
jgi:hypothetical protein